MNSPRKTLPGLFLSLHTYSGPANGAALRLTTSSRFVRSKPQRLKRVT
jgi:hypothetical protein